MRWGVTPLHTQNTSKTCLSDTFFSDPRTGSIAIGYNIRANLTRCSFADNSIASSFGGGAVNFNGFAGPPNVNQPYGLGEAYANIVDCNCAREPAAALAGL